MNLNSMIARGWALAGCQVGLAGWLALGSALGAADIPPVALAGGTLRERVEHFTSDEAALQRLHPYGLSRTRADRLRAFYEDHQRSLRSVPFDSLSRAGRIDFLLLRDRLGFELSELKRQEAQRAEMAGLLDFTDPILELEDLRRRMEPVAPVQAAETLAATARACEERLKALTDRLGDKGTHAGSIASQVVAYRAARKLGELRNLVREWREFYAGYDPEFTWWVKEPAERLDQKLKDYQAWVRRELVGAREGTDDPLVGDPIGRAALIEALATELIPYSPEELLEIAQLELAWCDREWARAATDLGFGTDWRKALDHVSRLHVAPGKQPALIRELALEAIKFLEDRELVTIPDLCKEVWRMEMMSPARQKVNPYFTGGEVISISFPTDSMSHEDKLMSLRGNNIHFCRATVQHELIPGHHLQGYMAQRYNSHRQLFRTPFLVEGWALYWEMLLWDLGFPKSAEDRVGMLFWRTHRCARILFSLKFHLGQMSADEAVKFLIDRVGHEPRNATAEVRRSILGDYSPLYQAAYMLGGLQIRALRKECVDSRRMTNREFHDAILRENAIPIELIRASLLESELKPDFRSQWRFYPIK